ncbi:PucR family transcriptional regulator [Rhodococcus sp. 27YEA15]|uniref:PucR family transcriptional regulator n=1 Tax=Rhodococcus sp. 27YEA15 TaxID=3156259 RepID=UPI003C7C40DC
MTVGGISLDAVLRALNGAFVELVWEPAARTAIVEAVILAEPDDLERVRGVETDTEIWLTVGLGAQALSAWLDRMALAGARPCAVMTKVASAESVRVAAERAGVALVSVHPDTRWDRLFTMIRGVLDHSSARHDPDDVIGSDTDLFELAQSVAALTRGMVSIEDERSHVLAYSVSDDAADELRRLSILGREGPREYLRTLHDWGVFDGLRRSDDVIEVPAHDELAIRRRLVVPIRRIGAEAGGTAADLLGTIWIQEGGRPIETDAADVLRGAAAVAARLITRIRDAPSNEAIQIQRLLGVRGGGVDVPSLAAALSIPTTGPALVVGISGPRGRDRWALSASERTAPGDLVASVRLHASAFHRESLVTAIGGRIYVLFPRTRSSNASVSWTREVIARLERSSQPGLRAAVSSPVATLAEVAGARAEVDRVLDGTTGDVQVTTLADSRTAVLLAEILERLGQDEQLRDPRIDALFAYDARNGSTMSESVRTYLAFSGDVRRAAERLQIHPNTLRYRIRRIEEITDTDLSDPSARLLMEIQLAVVARSSEIPDVSDLPRTLRG